MLTDYTGMEYALAHDSGTSALHAVLLACDIEEGGEVMVRSFTFVAMAKIDIRRDKWNQRARY